MKFLLSILLLIGSGIHAQVPTPRTTTTDMSGPYWTKSGNYDYTLYDEEGKSLTHVMDLKYLSTDSLGVLDKGARNVYILADFKNASSGDTGKAVVLSRNVGSSFYITNPYSFAHYVDDVYRSGPFCNIAGSYVYFVPEDNASYYLPEIRKFSNWGSNSSTPLANSESNTYWYRDADKGEYGVIKEGKTLDYSKVSPEKDGNDLIVSVDGVPTYRLPGYYTMASFVFKPVVPYSASNTATTTTTPTTGCVQGDCQNGWGKFQYDNGHYDGFWSDGLKNGYGLYKWPGTGKYIGNWVKDKMEGYGVYIAENNDNIIGNYMNGQLNGLGITVTGDKWEQGMFSNGNLVTTYDYFKTSNDSGCTAGDCQDKYGRYTWSNGDSFTGFFKNGKMHMGTYKFAGGDKYSGMFNNQNQFHGVGRFFFEDGGYYGGKWLNGKYSGKGYYHDKDYKQQIGQWENGNLVKAMK